MPIKNESGEVVLFLVSHKDVTKTKLASSGEHTNSQPGRRLILSSLLNFELKLLCSLQESNFYLPVHTQPPLEACAHPVNT